MEDARRAIETVRELAPGLAWARTPCEPRSSSSSAATSTPFSWPVGTPSSTAPPATSSCRCAPSVASSVVAAGVFNSGILAGGWTFDYLAAPPALLERRRALKATCARYGVPLAAAAIQFPLRQPAVTSILVGACTPAEIQEDMRLLQHPSPRRALARAGPTPLVGELRRLPVLTSADAQTTSTAAPTSGWVAASQPYENGSTQADDDLQLRVDTDLSGKSS